MVVAIFGEECGRAAMLVQLDPPAVEFDLMQPLLAARWSGAQSRSGWWQVTRKHVGIGRCNRHGLQVSTPKEAPLGPMPALDLSRLVPRSKDLTAVPSAGPMSGEVALNPQEPWAGSRQGW